jgi:hypothetical protein
MPGRRTTLPLAMITLVLIGALSTRSSYSADECLANPNAPALPGEHWYYRIDHAHNKRQCWRLGPEGLPVRSTAPQSEDATEPKSSAQQQPRKSQAVMPTPARAPTDVAPAPPADATPVPRAASTAPATAAPWPAVPGLTAFLPVPPQLPAAPQTASADSTVPATSGSGTSVAADDPAPAESVQTERLHRRTDEMPSATPSRRFAGIDYVFPLLIVMLVLLAVTGPILHITHRQRQREVINYKPPRWAPVIPLNVSAPLIRDSQTPAPAPRIERRTAPQQVRMTQPPHAPAWRLAPDLPEPADPNERLTRALRQIADRIQTIQQIQSATMTGRTRRADVGVLKNAR